MIKEGVKNRIILAISIFCLLFLFFAIGVTKELNKKNKIYSDEMRKRIETEEQNFNFQQQKVSFEDKIKQLSKELEESNTALEETNKALSQQELINKGISQELEKVTQIKEAVEGDLKETLIKKPQDKK